jgi:hypothetical protein
MDGAFANQDNIVTYKRSDGGSRGLHMSKFLSVALLAGASAIVALAPSQAEATPVAIWSGFVSVSTGFGALDFPQSATISNVGTQAVLSLDGSASVQSTATPLPAITSTATANATASGAEAFGSLFYYFAISGPASTALASVNVFANGSLFSDSGATMQSTDFLRVAGTTIVNASSFGGTNNGAFTASTTLSGLSYNVDYAIEMNALALVHPAGTASAFLDPYLFLDPDLLAQGYSIITSDGIGNNPTVSSAVPEPSTWAMMIFGFAGLGFIAYRRKSKPTSITL